MATRSEAMRGNKNASKNKSRVVGREMPERLQAPLSLEKVEPYQEKESKGLVKTGERVYELNTSKGHGKGMTSQLRVIPDSGATRNVFDTRDSRDQKSYANGYKGRGIVNPSPTTNTKNGGKPIKKRK